MSLILIRALNKKKALNALADIERHAKLSIDGKPRVIDVDEVEGIAKRILGQKPKSDIKLAILVRVSESTTKSIMSIKKIHPPAHLIVVSEEYPEYDGLNKKFSTLKVFQGYYSMKK
ncbi:MAG: hypothetical protein BZ137_08095 [Methanosphaera sp. rholeuAM130]|nr:DUF356 domain-containing protein [Methanosphaera sp.]RAP52836.1 MAG: hypothetical protein BZ137_08095 [Methanosphaera sp. rholeuAM130]